MRTTKPCRMPPALVAAAIATTLLGVLASARASAQNTRHSSAALQGVPPTTERKRPLVSLEGAGLFSAVSGDAFGDEGDGAGFDAMLVVGSRTISFGGGYQRASHTIGSSTNGAVISGAFIEPRMAVNLAGGDFTPYVFGRASRLARHGSASTGDHESNGTALGGGVGTLIWLAPNVQLNTGVMWQNLRFDRGSISFPKLPWLPGKVSGNEWSLRAGLSVGFEQWGR